MGNEFEILRPSITLMATQRMVASGVLPTFNLPSVEDDYPRLSLAHVGTSINLNAGETKLRLDVGLMFGSDAYMGAATGANNDSFCVVSNPYQTSNPCSLERARDRNAIWFMPYPFDFILQRGSFTLNAGYAPPPIGSYGILPFAMNSNFSANPSLIQPGIFGLEPFTALRVQGMNQLTQSLSLSLGFAPFGYDNLVPGSSMAAYGIVRYAEGDIDTSQVVSWSIPAANQNRLTLNSIGTYTISSWLKGYWDFVYALTTQEAGPSTHAFGLFTLLKGSFFNSHLEATLGGGITEDPFGRVSGNPASVLDAQAGLNVYSPSVVNHQGFLGVQAYVRSATPYSDPSRNDFGYGVFLMSGIRPAQ